MASDGARRWTCCEQCCNRSYPFRSGLLTIRTKRSVVSTKCGAALSNPKRVSTTFVGFDHIGAHFDEIVFEHVEPFRPHRGSLRTSVLHQLGSIFDRIWAGSAKAGPIRPTSEMGRPNSGDFDQNWDAFDRLCGAFDHFCVIPPKWSPPCLGRFRRATKAPPTQFNYGVAQLECLKVHAFRSDNKGTLCSVIDVPRSVSFSLPGMAKFGRGRTGFHRFRSNDVRFRANSGRV